MAGSGDGDGDGADALTAEDRERSGRQARSRSFGAVAPAYQRSRSGYTVDDAAWALDLPRNPLRVLEVAAGTGRLTLAVLATGAAVVLHAVEPDAGMRAEFARVVNDRRVELSDGTAESVPLPDASVDAVVVGSAFHWFDPARAMPELARVLVPGGTLAALWTGPDEEVDWVRSYRGAARGVLADDRDGPPGAPAPAGRDRAPAPAGRDRHRDIPASEQFGPTELRSEVHVEATPTEALTESVGTLSATLVASPDRRAAALRAVAEAVATAVPAGAVRPDGTVDLPIRVRGARCRRL